LHVIRLKRPWEKICLDTGQSQIVDVPEPAVVAAAEPTASKLAQMSYCRNFNAPTGLEASSRVYLRVSEWVGKLDRISLNGQVLDAAGSPFEADITDWIRPHNRIEIVLEDLPAKLARMAGEVTIVIDDQRRD
jgi:hypothetical protein